MTRKAIVALIVGASFIVVPFAIAGESNSKCGAGKCGAKTLTGTQSKCGSSKDNSPDGKQMKDQEKKTKSKCGAGKCGGGN